MADATARYAYQEVADDLREQISQGALPVGKAIPSTAQLEAKYGVSSTVARRAVNELRAIGLVVGRSGKGVFVAATPAKLAEDSVTLDDLASQVKALRGEVEKVQGVPVQEISDLKKLVGLIHAHLIDLYGRLGQPYPYESLSAIEESGRTEARSEVRRSGI